MGEGEPSIIMLCCEIPSLRAAPRLPGYSPARTSTRPAIPKSSCTALPLHLGRRFASLLAGAHSVSV